jgi:hypothetical protein
MDELTMSTDELGRTLEALSEEIDAITREESVPASNIGSKGHFSSWPAPRAL